MNFATSLRAFGLAILLGFTTLGSAGAESEISDSKLQAFVTAAVSVSKIIEQWTPRIESAESQEAADGLLAQANAELVAAIEETDEITLQEYKDISQAAQADPALSARIEEIVQERFGE
jgi:hypothetical protein